MNGVNKQLEEIGGVPVFVMSALKFERSDRVGEVIITAPEGRTDEYGALARERGVSKLTAVVAGGETRARSVMNALEKVSPNADYIAVHDGARPLIATSDIERVIADAERLGAAIAAAPAADTVKSAENGFVKGTLPRNELYLAQTPQVFRKELYLSCLERLGSQADGVTDDSSLLELCGMPVGITEISGCNIKITRPHDLIAARAVYELGKAGTV
ncbi:MAG: 2-C-methyl-D-erythritol 4-phosphate cytidylyltransferase [Lachnospiraceae bacterium]|nr:2-C-methyl-D-erythritol 4-phosphate cytidylyltransferase [Ruminococcus sp.]MCM1273760.1 2-C-methyl-D-erythritol 4-phosphate cytidylyltransferase [Lachnospiraceae bacterium]